MRRRGYTLIESMVALIIAALIIGAVWNSLHLVTVGERVADREAARALEEARAMELLLRDLRSASGPVDEQDGPRAGEKTYVFQRWVRRNERLASVTVSWKIQAGHRISRRLDTEPEMSFHFDPRMEKTQRPFKLKVERISTADWRKEGPVAPSK